MTKIYTGGCRFSGSVEARDGIPGHPHTPACRGMCAASIRRKDFLAYQIFCEKINCVEHLIGYEGNAFAFTGNAEENLLCITAVHPMREDAVKEFLGRAKADWSIIRELVARGQLIRREYGGNVFYMRKIH